MKGEEPTVNNNNHLHTHPFSSVRPSVRSFLVPRVHIIINSKARSKRGYCMFVIYTFAHGQPVIVV